ncbi:Lrp/AsnC family transcriptional regulator [Thalassovita sp.]|uniref:Lrp/AsnC family transcriptional regulator n=1 Tax=Thalassovita sp. TaxID=1979401 RepID=UPI002AB003DC|nr:Lrp/AsnC family transcriptional regulator [Thalassovita sp.]
MDLDHTNLRILSLLEKDARLPTAEIARQVHLSRPAVQERIARMEGAGVIAGYRVQIGQAGGVRAMVFVRIAERPCDPALQFLAAQTGVVEVASLSGELDAVVRVNLPTVAALADLNEVIGSSDLIAEARSQVILRVL